MAAQNMEVLEQKQQQLKDEMKKLEKKHRSNLIRLNVGRFIEGYGVRGIWPFYWSLFEIFSGDFAIFGIALGIASTILRVFILLVLWALLENWVYMLLIYAVYHLIHFGIGAMMISRAEAQLAKLDQSAAVVVDAYVNNCKKRLNIDFAPSSSGAFFEVDFENGMKFKGDSSRGNTFNAVLNRDGADMTIYCLENTKDYDAYTDRTIKSDKPLITLEKHIASTAFNKKFAVVLEKSYNAREKSDGSYEMVEDGENELGAVGFLSPSNQLNMINSKGIRNFSKISISKYGLSAGYGEIIPAPEVTTVAKWRSLNSNLKSIEKYAQAIRAAANNAYTDFEDIKNLLG